MSLLASMLIPSSASSGGVQLTGASYSSSAGGTDAIYLILKSNGQFNLVKSSGTTALTNWFSPTTTSIGNSYEVKAVVTSGSLDAGTSGTWYTISADRTFGIDTAGTTPPPDYIYEPDSQSVTFTLTIRRLSDSVVMAEQNFTLNSEAV